MNKLIKIWSFLRLAVCAGVMTFAATACDALGLKDGDIALSMDNVSVSSEAGSEFISVSCSKEWALSIDFNGAEKWASLSRESGKGNTRSASLSYDENTGDTERSLELILKSGNKSERLTFVQYAKGQGGSGDGEDSGGGTGSGAVPGWMELPAMQEALKYYSHDFDMNGRTYRNYSLGWDGKARLAHWVAYPLCDVYLGSQDRTNAWDYDPDVPTNEQPVLFKSYSGSDLDRGHQLPSNDRTCCYKANAQTFYFSNMTPQVGKRLNQAIWQKLELKLNAIAKRADTLYVVTGCTIEGGSRYTTDNNGNRCIVPTGYFKALLYYGRANTLGVEGYSGAAFYLENRSYSESYVDKSHCMSIDELEKKTGLDFFVNLPDAIEAVVEKENPDNVSIWW